MINNHKNDPVVCTFHIALEDAGLVYHPHPNRLVYSKVFACGQKPRFCNFGIVVARFPNCMHSSRDVHICTYILQIVSCLYPAEIFHDFKAKSCQRKPA